MTRIFTRGHAVGHAGALHLARTETAMKPDANPDAWHRIGPTLIVESFAAVEETGGRVLCAWLRRSDGAGLLWELDLTAPPGAMQKTSRVEGA
jgi:hypothetical protein